MFCATITVTDHTAAAQNLFTLLSKGSQTGYTVSPAAGIITNLTMIASASYLSIQASPSNSGITLYKGDENTANDGSRQAKELQNGDVDVSQAYPYSVNLQEIYMRASADGGKFNVEIHYS